MSDTDHYDVIVIGVGSMGSSACYFLAQRGMKVLGLEQFSITHDRGSHAGQSRIIRKAYFEHPDYVPLLERAYSNWRAFEQVTRAEIYHRTGIVYFGRPDHETMQGIKHSASQYNLQVDKLSSVQAHKQFPAFHFPSDFEVLTEPDSGFVTPEHSIRLYTDQAIKLGATIQTSEAVTNWEQIGGKVHVQTNKNSYSADKLIIAAGSWAAKMVPNLKPDLKVTRQTLAWVDPTNTAEFVLGKFPCWFIEDPELGMFYGFPVLPADRFGSPMGLKIAHHRPGEITNPDIVSHHPTPDAVENIQYILSKYLPTAGRNIISLKNCLYTYTKDEHFIIDHLPGYSGQITIACGFSGHGFKFVSVVGEILADLAMKGKTDLPVEFLRLSRLRFNT